MSIGINVANKNGRPSRTEQIEIQKKIKPYFERNINATITASKTGNNIKTVCKYFAKWSQQREDFEIRDFEERRKKEIENITTTFDLQIIDGYEFRDYLDEEITKLEKKNKMVPRYLYTLKLETMKHISA